MDIWQILGIPPTTDEANLKEAFVHAAHALQAQADSDGLVRLQKAYREAITMARRRNGTKRHRSTAAVVRQKCNLRRISTEGAADSSAPTPDDPTDTPDFELDTTVSIPMAATGQQTTTTAPTFPTKASSIASPPMAAQDADVIHFPQHRQGEAAPMSDGTEEQQKPPVIVLSAPSPSPPHHSTTPTGVVIPCTFPENLSTQNANSTTPPDGNVMPADSAGNMDFPATDAASAVPNMPDSGGMEDFDGMGFGGLIFPAMLEGASTPPLPQTQQPNIHEEVCTELCQRLQALAQTEADLDRWEEVFNSTNFLSLQHSSAVVRQCVDICKETLTLPTAIALYSAYGFASSRSATTSPHLSVLRGLLRGYVALPEEDIPLLPFATLKKQSMQVLDSIERLCAAPQSVFLWQQALQTADFVQLRYQPYFLHLLTDFLRNPSLPLEFLQVLAQVYIGDMRLSPCVEPLYAHLPQQIPAQPWPKPAQYAANLLREGVQDFYRTSEDKIFSLLEQTASGFKHSQRQAPWKYVFDQPQFTMLRDDANFIHTLCDFAQNNPLPLPFWHQLQQEYRQPLAQPDTADSTTPSDKNTDTALRQALQRLNSLVDERLQVSAQRNRREQLRAFPREHPWLLGLALAYVVGAVLVMTIHPLIGAVLLGAVILFLL